MSLLEAKGLTAGYGRVQVLFGVDVTLHAGAVTALVGPNGHGKSTLLKSFAGLVRVQSGTLTFEGRPLPSRASDRAMAGLTLVPQGDRLFSGMSVQENLLMGAYRRRVNSDETLGWVFDLFPRLKERRTQSASSLSGGERRMVGLGRGIMAGGDLMMIDEPSLGLSPLLIEQVYSAIETMANKGMSILVVEESPRRIEDVADNVLLMDSGRIVWNGETARFWDSDVAQQVYLGA